MLENNQVVNPEEEKTPTPESLEHPKSQTREDLKGNKKSMSMSNVRMRFTSCGRCSMFLAAYRIANDDQALETAISHSDSDWLPLPWNQELRRLIIKSYGYHLDADVYFFEGSCPECLGKFRYSESEDDKTAILLFKI
jgi:hypothetical protein